MQPWTTEAMETIDRDASSKRLLSRRDAVGMAKLDARTRGTKGFPLTRLAMPRCNPVMTRRMYTSAGRYLANLEIPGRPEAVAWNDKVVLREDDGVYVEVHELACGVVALPVSPPGSPDSDLGQWGEDHIGNEGINW